MPQPPTPEFLLFPAEPHARGRNQVANQRRESACPRSESDFLPVPADGPREWLARTDRISERYLLFLLRDFPAAITEAEDDISKPHPKSCVDRIRGYPADGLTRISRPLTSVCSGWTGERIITVSHSLQPTLHREWIRTFYVAATELPDVRKSQCGQGVEERLLLEGISRKVTFCFITRDRKQLIKKQVRIV